MKTVEVELGERSYQISIGRGLVSSADELLPWIKGRQACIITNEVVAPLYLDQLRRGLAGKQVVEQILPDGERYKNLGTVESIFNRLLQIPCDREVTIIALGGGVVGDMAGFAAACYQRGVAFIQVPTTLLSQVDSSVGGKTGVNHALGKNMIGAFHQPRRVIADTATLDTLDQRQFAAGLAEVIKYGVIDDAVFFSWLEQNIAAVVARDPDALEFMIARSCTNKAKIVARDELENGVRALLNLGHTFAHAIEAGMGYGEWLHGEAVATGISMASHMSKRLGWIAAGEDEQINQLLSAAGLPVGSFSGLSSAKLLQLMKVDKKVRDSKLRLVLLQGIGNAEVVSDYPAAALEQTVEHFIAPETD